MSGIGNRFNTGIEVKLVSGDQMQDCRSNILTTIR